MPKNLLGKALSYLDENWNKLTIYTQDGRLSNKQPRSKLRGIRPIEIETAKANQLEPYQSLRHIFSEIPKATSPDQSEVLLPWNVKNLQDEIS